MRKVDKDGQSRWQLITEIYEQTGVQAPELINPPEIPPMLEKEWQWFEEISRGRDCSMGLTSLKWSEMNAYFQIRGINPQQWQIDLILAFDAIWVDVMGDDTEEISSF